MNIRLVTKSSMLAVLLCAVASAQTHKPFPGETPDQRTLRIQDRVEELYSAGNYERARLIYQKDLAPLGDKYAQYMVGYMHLNAQGVTVDRAEALAWYRLAAERGESVLEQAQDELLVSMSAEEIATSNRIFIELWKSIGDTKLVMKLIRRDMNALKARTGSRIPVSASTSPSLIYRPSGELLGPNHYREIRLRLEARLNYLEIKVEISDIAVQNDNEDIRILEEQVREELAALERP